MQEIIQQLMAKANLTEQQAMQAVQTMKEYIMTKLPPQMAPMVDNFFVNTFASGTASGATGAASAASGAAGTGKTAESEDWRTKAKEASQSAGDAFSSWASKAEDMAGDTLNKLKDMFGGHKEDHLDAQK
jgi:mevalonate pyrophosphate decarboxylase